jgi:hypothetical protein
MTGPSKLRPGDSAPTTFAALAGLDTSLGGRFAPGGYVAGSEASVEYPRQPASSPWASDPVGLEPSLGFSVNQMEPTGTHVEIERSLGGSVAAPSAILGSSAATVVSSPASVAERAGPPNPIRRRV